MIKEIKELLEKCSITVDNFGPLEDSKVFTISKKKNVEKELEKIFSIVKETFPSHLHNPILYLLGELSDNINQHSHYSKGFIVLRYDKNTKEMFIIIFDDGISIPGGFEENNISFNNDSQSIEMAIRGKSTKKEEGRGFGLSTSKKLVEKGFEGTFLVASRKGIYKNKDQLSETPERINGTLVYINFSDKGEGLNIYEYLT